MARLKFDDPILVAGIILVYVFSVLLWGMYGCYPYHYPPWPIERKEILDNLFTDSLFFGIGLIAASTLIEGARTQRSKSSINSLCGALSRLVVFADMRIAKNDNYPSPSFDDRVLFKLYHWGGSGKASKEMEAITNHFQMVYLEDFFIEDRNIHTMYLPLIPRVEKYLTDTEGIRRDIRTDLISRAITNIDDADMIKHLEKFWEIFIEYDDNINRYASKGDVHSAVAEINNFLIYTKEAYVILKGGHFLRPIGALYGPEDPPGICI